MGGNAGGGGLSSSVYYFDIKSEEWTSGPDMISAKSDFGIVMMQNPDAFGGAKLIVVVGGSLPGGNVTNSVEILNLYLNNWTEGERSDVMFGIIL